MLLGSGLAEYLNGGSGVDGSSVQNPTLSGERLFGFVERSERVVGLFVVEGVAAVGVDVGSLGG